MIGSEPCTLQVGFLSFSFRTSDNRSEKKKHAVNWLIAFQSRPRLLGYGLSTNEKDFRYWFKSLPAISDIQFARYCLTVFICPYYLYRAQWSIAIGCERQHVKFILCEFPKASNTSAKTRVASDSFRIEWIICVLNFVQQLYSLYGSCRWQFPRGEHTCRVKRQEIEIAWRYIWTCRGKYSIWEKIKVRL